RSRPGPGGAVSGMRAIDLMSLSWGAIAGHRLRSALTMLGIAIGIASVILLTSIGEGIRVYVLCEFTQFGTNLIALTPGKSNTTGGNPTAMAGTIRKMSIEDAEGLRSSSQVVVAMAVPSGN